MHIGAELWVTGKWDIFCRARHWRS